MKNIKEQAETLAKAIDISFENAFAIVNDIGDLQGLSQIPTKALTNYKGIGPSKVEKIQSIFKIVKNIITSNIDKKQLNDSKIVAEFVRPIIAFQSVEHFHVIYVNTQLNIIHNETMFTGGLNSTVVDIRVIVKRALLLNATGIFIAHNHPSDITSPSEHDKKITVKLKNACDYFDIKLIDHIIITKDDHYSFSLEGYL